MENSILKLDNKVTNGNEVVSILCGGIPLIGGVLGGSISFANQKLIAKRLQILLEMLNKGDIDFDNELIEKDFFIHGISIVVEAVGRTNSDKKIKFFSELLINGVKEDEILSDIDGFEYYVKLLDSVSYVEMKLLEIIHSIDAKMEINEEGIDDTSDLNTILFTEIRKYISYDEKVIIGILDKLTYSGLLNKVQVNSFVWGATESRYYYKVSSLYQELRNRISIDIQNFSKSNFI